MAHSHSFDAIVLKTYDVGEADRFCILFTRERGRVAARASGARRLHSRLGGALLPFRHITVELKEGNGGWIIAGAQTKGNQRNQGIQGNPGCAVAEFAALEEGIELLLRLVTDEGALPEVFDATLAFIHACGNGVSHAGLGYGFMLLHCLGLLPEGNELREFQPLTAAQSSYVDSCRSGTFVAPAQEMNPLHVLQSILLADHLHTPLRSKEAIEAMR